MGAFLLGAWGGGGGGGPGGKRGGNGVGRKTGEKGGRGLLLGGENLLTVWGSVELSLTVPITNSLAFLFTVLGEWWAEGKVISRGEFLCFVGVVCAKRGLMDGGRYLDWDGVCAGGDCAVCAVEEYLMGEGVWDGVHVS